MLAFRFFGPYRILAKVGSVAYRLELPPLSAIHPVFHVSQLKKAVGADHTVTPEPPSESSVWSIPERILQRRYLRQGTASVLQGLIKWTHLLESLTTWEKLADLQQQFPRALVWDQPGAQEGGSVSAVPVQQPATDTDQASSKGKKKAQERKVHQARPKSKSVRFFGPEWHHE